MVPVPRDRVQEVYEVLARPRRSPQNAQAEPDSVRSSDTFNSEAFLKRCYRDSQPAMRSVLEHLAKNAGRAVTSEELAEAIGQAKDETDYTREQLAGVLGAFGRRFKNRYNGGTVGDGNWPFSAEWSPEDGMYVYQMEPGIAKIFKSFLP